MDDTGTVSNETESYIADNTTNLHNISGDTDGSDMAGDSILITPDDALLVDASDTLDQEDDEITQEDDVLVDDEPGVDDAGAEEQAD